MRRKVREEYLEHKQLNFNKMQTNKSNISCLLTAILKMMNCRIFRQFFQSLLHHLQSLSRSLLEDNKIFAITLLHSSAIAVYFLIGNDLSEFWRAFYHLFCGSGMVFFFLYAALYSIAKSKLLKFVLFTWTLTQLALSVYSFTSIFAVNYNDYISGKILYVIYFELLSEIFYFCYIITKSKNEKTINFINNCYNSLRKIGRR